jgi:hypothetical protein
VPIIRDLVAEGRADVEVTAAWDSAETRPEGFAREFCAGFNIPNAVDSLDAMLPLVDGVIVHTTNWDRHLEQARPFVEAGKSVFLDKPIVGNLRDAGVVLDWLKQGKRVTGGSSLRFTREIAELLAIPAEERGEIHTAYTAIGVDDFNYGIHAYSLLLHLMGPGILYAQYLDASVQKQVLLKWKDGRSAILTIGPSAWLPFNVTAVTPKKVYQVGIDHTKIYRSMLEAVVPYLSGKTDTPPLPMSCILEPELAAMAARISWMNNGQKIFLTDLRQDEPGYDGTEFALSYRRSRMK